MQKCCHRHIKQMWYNYNNSSRMTLAVDVDSAITFYNSNWSKSQCTFNISSINWSKTWWHGIFSQDQLHFPMRPSCANPTVILVKFDSKGLQELHGHWPVLIYLMPTYENNMENNSEKPNCGLHYVVGILCCCLWSHSPCNSYVIPMSLYKFVSS